MHISYKWLKDYLNTSLNPHEIAAALTQLGLETGSVEEVESIKGGLRGLVVGEVLTCGKHPGSDHQVSQQSTWAMAGLLLSFAAHLMLRPGKGD